MTCYVYDFIKFAIIVGVLLPLGPPQLVIELNLIYQLSHFLLCIPFLVLTIKYGKKILTINDMTFPLLRESPEFQKGLAVPPPKVKQSNRNTSPLKRGRVSSP